jgi:hypothetical protein
MEPLRILVVSDYVNTRLLVGATILANFSSSAYFLTVYPSSRDLPRESQDVVIVQQSTEKEGFFGSDILKAAAELYPEAHLILVSCEKKNHLVAKELDVDFVLSNTIPKALPLLLSPRW